MEEYALYEVVMQAFNDVGSSTLSPKAIERTRESGKFGEKFQKLFLIINI